MPIAAPITPLDPENAARFVIDEAYAKECLTTPPAEALQEDFMRYSADFAWWSERSADARREVALLKLEVDTLKGDADAEVRESIAKAGGKVTEAAVDAALRSHPGLLAAKKRLIDGEHFAGRIDAVVDGLRAKRDMLVGLGATFRAEQKADPLLRD